MLLATFAVSTCAGSTLLRADSLAGERASASDDAMTPEAGRALFEEARASVLPKAGFRSGIASRDSALKLVAEGIFDPAWCAAANHARDARPVGGRNRVTGTTHQPLRIREGREG